MIINFYYFNKYILFKKLPFLTIALFIVIVNLSLAQSTNNKIIADVSPQKITAHDFKTFLINKLQSCARIDTLSASSMNVYLDSLINSTLILNEAESTNLNNNPSLVKNVNEFTIEATIDRLIEHEVIDSIITKEKLKDFYEKYGGELQLRQVVIRNNLHDEALANSIYSEIMNGMDIKIAAKRFSQDAMTAKNGGDIGFVRWGQLSEQIQDTVFTLKQGEISHPIKTPFGYYIIQVVSKTKCGFKDEYRNLKYQMAAYYGKTIQYNKKLYLTNLEKKYGVKLIDSNIKKIIEQIGLPYAPFESIPENLTKIPLVLYQNQSINLKDLINKVGADNVTNYHWNEKTFTNWLSSISMDRISILEAKRLELNANEDIQKYKNQLMIALMKDKILDVNVPEEELQNYYKKNENDFVFPQRVRVKYVVVSEQFIAKDIFKLAKEGKDFDRLVNDYTLDSESRKNNGDIGFISRNQSKEIYDASINLKIGEITGPVLLPQGFAVIKLIDREESSIKSFDEAKNQIVSILLRKKKEAAYNNFITSLKRKYKVTVNHKIFAEFIKNPLSYNFSFNTNSNQKNKHYAKISN